MKIFFILLLIAYSLVSCSDKNDVNIPEQQNEKHLSGIDNVGKVELVEVKASGSGNSIGEAVNEALKLAIAQANGVSVNSSSANLNIAAFTDAKISTTNNSVKIKEALKSKAFADLIVNQSQGIVSSFKVEKVSEKTFDSGVYTVEVIAKISKFKNSQDDGKLKIVVMPLKAQKSTFEIAGKTVSSNEVLEPIRQQIIDSLVQSGRFTILDRQYSNDIQAELGLIESGETSRDDMAKLSQAMSADVIWIGSLNDFSYDKSVRRLNTSGRDLISYSGSWSITQRLVNLTTRQVLLSETFKGNLPYIAPSSTVKSISGSGIVSDAQTEIARKATKLIISKTFPIKIVNIDGDKVVINQGDGVLVEGSIYKVVSLGKEVSDPHTGQSLGNLESDCCEVEIERVTSKLSYGQLKNFKINLNGININSLQLSEIIQEKKQQLSDNSQNSEGKSKNKRIVVDKPDVEDENQIINEKVIDNNW